jgi:hypothetical protein
MTIKQFLITLAISCVAAPVSAQTSTIFQHSENENISYTVRYDGEGWKNLRRVWFNTSFFSGEHWQSLYVVCNTDKLILPWKLAASGPASFDEYAGKSSDDRVITFGEIVEASASAFVFPIDAPQEARLFKALKVPCQKPAPVRITPADIDLGFSNDQHFKLVPDRFSRSGDRISVWIESSFFKSVDGTKFKTSWTFNVIDLKRGREMQKQEIDCKNYELAATSHISYDSEGRVLKSQSIDAKNVRLDEAIPGSVGDSWVQGACLVE